MMNKDTSPRYPFKGTDIRMNVREAKNPNVTVAVLHSIKYTQDRPSLFNFWPVTGEIEIVILNGKEEDLLSGTYLIYMTAINEYAAADAIIEGVKFTKTYSSTTIDDIVIIKRVAFKAKKASNWRKIDNSKYKFVPQPQDPPGPQASPGEENGRE